MALKSKFCPKCGEEAKELFESVCSKCYIHLNKPSIPKSATVKYCTVCKSVLMRSLWISVPDDPTVYLEKKMSTRVKLAPLETLKKLKIIKLGKEGEIKLVTELGGELFERIIKGTPAIEKFACPECSRQFKTSITGIIQLRTSGNARTFVTDALGFIGKDNRKIVKADERLQGIDLSFSDKRTARVLARKLKEHYKCTYKESVKQRGWDRMKERPLVQATYLLRCKR